MKIIEGSLKLAFHQIVSDSFNRDMLALRSVGRLMSSWRETSVHRNTLKELKKRYPQYFLNSG